MVSKDEDKYVVWPIYFDKTVSRINGRKVAKKHAIEKTGRHGNIVPFQFNISHGGNRMAGFIKGASFWGGLHIDNIYIERKSRLKGFGTTLIDRVCRLAEDKVYKFVSIETFDNTLLKFLVSQGFQVDFAVP